MNIDAGLTRECLHDLTGAPTETLSPKDNNTWINLLAAEKQNFTMTAGSEDSEGRDMMNSKGLVGSHAYSLLSAHEITDKFNRKIKLVKIRNPWG